MDYRRWWIGLFAPFLIFLLLDFAFPLDQKALFPDDSSVVLDREGKLLRAFLAKDEMWRIYADVEALSPHLIEAVLAYEDQHFYWHFGVDPIAVGRAIIADIKAGKIVQGASTIPMQIARMSHRRPRTFRSKLIEVFRAFQLEWHYSKAELLTMYFNHAPYGGNLVGAGTASWIYFNKPASELSIGEAALLAGIPNNPNQNRPDVNPENAKKVRQKILSILRTDQVISQADYELAFDEPLPAGRRPLPFSAPHLSDFLHQKYPSTTEFITTIDEFIQNQTRRILAGEITPLKSRGITNGAVIIIENATMNIVAYVGSADFGDTANSGQVNGVYAPRSPGSTLKPFIYALGMDHGLISNQTRLSDVPVDYNGYSPVNFDETYSGLVSAEEALIRSLNVPAVNLYAQLHQNGLHHFLRSAGVTTIPKAKDYYGLSLVLGGSEMRLIELAGLYAGLARGGQFAKPRFLHSDLPLLSNQLLSAESSFLVTDILTQLRRPNLPAVWEWSVNMPKIAWKTGTSYGKKDAWSVGYNKKYTVAVWAGNFDATGHQDLIGVEVAAPILFQVFNALNQSASEAWFTAPKSILHRQVCSISGRPATEWCITHTTEAYIPGKAPNSPCNIHQPIEIEIAGGYRVCSHCRRNHETKTMVFERWPAEVATWMQINGFPVTPIPEHLPSCSHIASGEAPIFTSPADEAVFKIRKGVDLQYQKIPLSISVSNQTHNIYWFINGKEVASGEPSDVYFWEPSAGRHKIMCQDDEGRSTEISILIQK